MTIKPFAIVLAAASLGASYADVDAAMSDYRWKKRPLVVFADSDGDISLATQRKAVVASRAGYAERDMAVIWVVGDRVSTELGASPGLSAAALRTRFGVASGSFRALLVGKDGGVKISSAKPIATRTLFDTIDSMPMRQDEMRRR